MKPIQSYQLIVLGAGESGVGAAILAKQKGQSVFVSDKGQIQKQHKQTLIKQAIPFEEEQHTRSLILAAKEIVKSPGIPDKVPLIKEAKEKGIPIISEIELAARYVNPKAVIIAITGSNGKTTTTSLVYHLLKTAGLKVAVGGNIGTSFTRLVATGKADYYVLEISSFQLDNIVEFQPHISIITNITPDHLDHYNYQFENYIASKFRITSNQKSQHHLIYNEDDATTTTYLAEHPQMVQQYPISLKQKVANGAYVESGIIIWKSMQQDVSMLASKLALKGKHNQYNALMAGKVAQLLGISGTTIQKALGNFDSLEHRLETVTTIEEVVFINDSKATNIDAVWYALDAIDQPIVWIVGGVDKGNDYEVLMSLVQQKVKAIVCLGKDNSKIHQAFDTKQLKIVNTKSAKTAVKKAWKLAEKGDVVLLSPACASFDLFKNYIDRGKQFKKAVLDLKAKTEKTILVAI